MQPKTTYTKNFSTLNKTNTNKVTPPQYSSAMNKTEKNNKTTEKNNKTTIKNDQNLNITTNSKNKETNSVDFESLMEQMRAEKQKFYYKLNNLSSRRHEAQQYNIEKHIKDENSGFILNDSGDLSENFTKYDKNITNLYENESKRTYFLDKNEMNSLTQNKILDELQRTKEKKQKVLGCLNNAIQKKEEDLKKIKTTQDSIKNSLTEFLNSLKEENQDLEKKLENARENLEIHEKTQKESADFIRNYEHDIEKLEEMLFVHKEESEKELRNMNNELEKEKKKFEILTKKAEEISETLALNKKNNVEFEQIQKDLDEKTKNLMKWTEKKRVLEIKIEVLTQDTTVAFDDLNSQIKEKTIELNSKKEQFDEFCQRKDEEIKDLHESLRKIEEEIVLKEEREKDEKKIREHEMKKFTEENKKMENELVVLQKDQNGELKKIEDALQNLQEKVIESEQKVEEMEKMNGKLTKEIEESKPIYEKQMNTLENEIKFYLDENKTLKENIENKKTRSKTPVFDSGNEENTLKEIKQLDCEIEKNKKEVDSLNKIQRNLDEEIKGLGGVTLRENEKNGMKKDVEILKKNKIENDELIKKMNLDKENLEKELKEIEKLTNIYQLEIEESLESINKINDQEVLARNKSKKYK